MLEDELFRMATATSFYIYGIDADEKGKISALEAEFVPEEGIPYGIDAGGWGGSSVKGIENFPHLRHLDVTGSPNIKEMDLSGVDREHDNYYMMQDCPELKRIYVWKGWTEDYYDMFYYDDDRNIEIIEK